MDKNREADAALDAGAIASAIIERGDRDIAFVLRVVGESHYLLVRHFRAVIERELERRGVVYGDHPLLRLLVETHGRELADFVTNAVGLKHQIGLAKLEQFAGDPAGLLRVDLWDSLRSSIEAAERHLVSPAGGLAGIVAEVDALRGGAEL